MIKIDNFNLDDFDLLNSWIKTEEELIQFAGTIFTFPLTRDQVGEFLNMEQSKVFKVIHEENGSVIGIAELYDLSQDANKIARVLIGKESLRGKGFGTKLMQILVEHSFKIDNKDHVYLNVYGWNTSAIRCYQRVGFHRTDKKPLVVKVGDEEWKSLQMKIDRGTYFESDLYLKSRV